MGLSLVKRKKPSRHRQALAVLVLAMGWPSLGLVAEDRSWESMGMAAAFPDLFSEQYPLGLVSPWMDERGEPPFDWNRLSKPEQTLYHQNAGVYFPKKFGREPIASHLLQLMKTTFTWGKDFYLFDSTGAVDYSSKEGSFLANVGPGWFNPLPLGQVSPVFLDQQGWYRLSSATEPMAYLKKLVKERQRKNQGLQGSFPAPKEAMKLVEASSLRVLAALREGNEQDLVKLVSQKRGLELTNLWWTQSESTRVSYDELQKKAAAHSGLWTNQFFPLMVKALFEGRRTYLVYPNLFVNKDIEFVLRNYGRSILLEFQFYTTSRLPELRVTSSALNLIFVPEEGDWKLCALELFEDLR